MKKILTSNGKPLFKDGKVFLSDGIGGGNASIIKPGGWRGTTVPNTGAVENVYVNTSLTVDEVNTLLDIIIFTIEGANETIVVNENYSKQLSVINVAAMTQGTYSGYMIAGVITVDEENINVIPIFNSSIPELAEELGLPPFEGWHSEFNGVFEFNDIAINAEGMFGINNEALALLFSSTPFEMLPNEILPLNGEYDGSTVTVNISNSWRGTPVPNTGIAPALYLNTDMSIEEVIEILSTIDLEPEMPYILASAKDVVDTYDAVIICVLQETTDENGNVIKLIQIQEVIYDGTLENIVTYGIIFDSTEGWKYSDMEVNPYPYTDFNLESSFAAEGMELSVGEQNDKISSLFSTTPFTFGYQNLIDVESYLSESKLPLQFKLKVDEKSFDPGIPDGYLLPEGTINITENGTLDVSSYASANVDIPVGANIEVTKTPVPNSGYVEKVYFNTSLTTEEVNVLIKEFLFSKGTHIGSNIIYYVVANNKSGNDYREIMIAWYSSSGGSCRISVRHSDGSSYNVYYDGWLYNYSNDVLNDIRKHQPYIINSDVVSSTSSGFSVGNYNDMFSKLFSTTLESFADSVTITNEINSVGIEITENGITDISKIIQTNQELPLIINTKVPIPSGYVKPQGTSTIKVNGTYNVFDLEKVKVNVPVPSGYIKPSGTINITTTADTNVTNYATAKIVDSNLIPENIAKDITILGITGTYENINKIHEFEDKFINGHQFSADDYSNDRINIIEAYAFAGRWDGPILNETFPNCEWVLKGAFLYANRGDRVTEAHFPKCTIIGANSFEGHSYLSTIDFPKATIVEAYAFKDCSNLESINLPLVKTIGKGAFMNCYAYLKTINLPQVTSIWEQAFEFTALTDIYLGSEQVATLINSNAFASSATTLTRYVHVKAELLSEYQADAVWAEAVSKGYVTLVGDYTD